MSFTLLFYLCVDFIAVSLLACADNMVSDSKRKVIQAKRHIFLFDKTFVVKAHHLCFLVSFLVLFLVIALRDHVGTDYNLYSRAFLNINSGVGVDENWLPPLYIALNSLVGIFAPRDYEFMFALVGFLTMFFLYKAIYKMSCCWWLSLYIFICFCFYYQSFNQFRQMLAISLTTYGIYFLSNDKTKKFFLLYVCIAGMIHKSALIMLLLYPCSRVKMNKKNLLVYAFVIIGIHIAYSAFLWVVNQTSYSRYIGSQYDTYMDTQTILNVIARFSMLVGCLLFIKRTIKRNPNTLVFYNSAIICIIFTSLTMRSHAISRLTSYFYWPFIFLIPEVLKSIQSYLNSTGKRTMVLLTFLLFLAYHFVYYFNPLSIASGYSEYRMMFFSNIL